MNRRLAITVGFALLVSTALAVAFKPAYYPPYNEGKYYFAIARSDSTNVYSYYGARVFHPLLVRGVATLAHVPLDSRVFLRVSMGSLIALFLFLGAHYGVEYSAWPWMWLLLPATATLVDQYRNYYWHDLFYAALCALFFLVLRAHWLFGLPVLFLLYLTRESTIVLVVVLALVALFRRQWLLAASAPVVGIAAMLVVSHLTAQTLPNREGVPILVLDALKIPYNFALNFCGVELWSNANAETFGKPRWVADVPSWLHLGNIHQVGFIGFSWQRPVQLLVVVCTAFGTLPVLLVRLMARGWGRELFARFDLAVAFYYGALMFLLAPLVGTTPSRYELYAWPVFWLFCVGVLSAAVTDARRRIELVLLCLAASWVPAILHLISNPKPMAAESLNALSNTSLLLSLLVLTPIYVRTWHLSRPRSASS